MRIFCSICKDLFAPYSEVHVTNCGHLYHGSCISTWFKQHRTCPQCRTKMSQPFRIYFDVEKDNNTDPSTLELQVETLTDKLRETEREKKSVEDDLKNFKTLLESMKECAMSLSEKNHTLKTSVKALKEQVAKLSKQKEAVTELENKLEEWKGRVSTLERIEALIQGSTEEVNKMLENTPVSQLAVKQLCTFVGVLKTQLHTYEKRNFALIKENRELSKSLAEEKKNNSSKSEEIIKNLKASNSKLEAELYGLKILYKDYKKKYFAKKEEAPSVENATQVRRKSSLGDFDFDFLDSPKEKSTHSNSSVKVEKTITQWEELVCAGPSRQFGKSLKNSRSFNKTFNSNEDMQGLSSSSYAFDGLGGRKKLKLGCPTPLEEFEKIKKKKEKKLAPSIQHKKIFEYCKLEESVIHLD